MKQMHGLATQTNFPIFTSKPGERTLFFSLWSKLKQKMSQHVPSRRHLLLSGAATVGITMLVAATSYLFFIQLAANGW